MSYEHTLTWARGGCADVTAKPLVKKKVVTGEFLVKKKKITYVNYFRINNEECVTKNV